MLQDVHMDDTLYVRNPDSVLPQPQPQDNDDLAGASGEKEKDGGDKPMDIDFSASAAPAAGADPLPDHMDDYGKWYCITKLVLV